MLVVSESPDLAMAIKSFLPGDDPEANVSYESDWLTIRVASPRYCSFQGIRQPGQRR